MSSLAEQIYSSIIAGIILLAFTAFVGNEKVRIWIHDLVCVIFFIVEIGWSFACIFLVIQYYLLFYVNTESSITCAKLSFWIIFVYIVKVILKKYLYPVVQDMLKNMGNK